MQSTLETILNHRSIRKFKNTPLTSEQIDTIIDAAQHASTSSYMMAYTIIGITDPAKKEELSRISTQPYVKQNGHLLVFCADLYKPISKASEEEYVKMLPNLENSEHFLVSSIDAALAAQNAALAAESLGLGICFLGSLRNNMGRVDELLHLPKHVIPLFGMAIGVPDHQPEIKPRLPKEAVYFENEYRHPQNEIDAFDEKISAYYQSRSSNQRKDTWSDQMRRRFLKPIRMDVTDTVQQKGFNKR
ncbi:oxygen-insensitive NADPH nitroreductase [Halobacillus salinarum]|uniref:Oxygen-insensitive NADPH nitroreductase n=1 Tax=Halobacillus salinarum TaxID=2932257 RepID=A0ABY4EFM2_9BACI|nr:oxygen-insensitive NADPH nitroreductase [Halobacillus salinarum]UOQ43260.1 oxygen-insensitive NADPH nitroreductase [Halobacillus salinarum]